MLQYSGTPCRYQVSLQVSIFSSCDIYTTSSKLMYLLWLQNIPIHPNTLRLLLLKYQTAMKAKLFGKKFQIIFLWPDGFCTPRTQPARWHYCNIYFILYLASISSSSSANPFQRNSYKIGFTVLWFNYVWA